MRENVGTFLGKAENWRTGSFLQAANLCQEYFRTCGKFLTGFADLRLAFAWVHASFRRGLVLSTTASAFSTAPPQWWWPVFPSSSSVSDEIQSGSSLPSLSCAPMINSFS